MKIIIEKRWKNALSYSEGKMHILEVDEFH